MSRDVERERHDHIARAALSVLAERGISGTTLERIASKANMSRGHVRYFLGNREQLLTAAAEAFYVDPYIIPPDIDTVLLAVDHLFGEDFAAPGPENRVVRAFIELATTSNRIAVVLAEAYEASRVNFRALVEKEHPATSPHILDEVAQGVMTMALGNAFLSDFDRDSGRNPRARAAALRFLATL